MQKVLTAAEMREVDRRTTEEYGIPSIILMENAAHAVARVITEKLGGSVKNRRIVILCGKGNNGGDGAALARILWSQGASCFVYLTGTVEQTKGDARINFQAIKTLDEGRDVPGPNENCLFVSEVPEELVGNFIAQWRSMKFDVFVDALLGTGFSGELRPPYARIVSSLKSGRRFLQCDYFVSLDIPSGIRSDFNTGTPEHTNADITITFTAPKPGNVLAPASYSNGELIVASIGSPTELIDEQPSQLYLADSRDAATWLKRAEFSNDSYKNKRGHTLLIAGSEDYSGAAVLAGNAAMRSGVGLVTLVTPRSSKESVAARILPEIMVRGVAETENGAVSTEAFDEIKDLLQKADAVAIGCGLSQNESTRKFVEKVVAGRCKPTIVDADALNLLSPFSGEDRPDAEAGSRTPLILTPHEGEFLRLLGTDDKDSITDRVAAVREFATKHKVILVLKGERVLIGEPSGKVVVNPTGNSGLGKAGNGDTLTGILAGFVAQAAAMKVDVFETVVAAVYIAGLAGDIAEKKYGNRVMTASDVRECLAAAFEAVSRPV